MGETQPPPPSLNQVGANKIIELSHYGKWGYTGKGKRPRWRRNDKRLGIEVGTRKRIHIYSIWPIVRIFIDKYSGRRIYLWEMNAKSDCILYEKI